MIFECWLDELQCLALRHPETGVGCDLPSMSLCELWGAYLFLRSVEEARHG